MAGNYSETYYLIVAPPRWWMGENELPDDYKEIRLPLTVSLSLTRISWPWGVAKR